MKTKNLKTTKKINLNKMKIATLSKAEKNQVNGGGGIYFFHSWICWETEEEEEQEQC
ncbi:class I lanthipeptide [uncultured Aquimarina sp.]|uniref:class I lanthipeptide n=1 Tax=uncultured Aquimarina sp. TaxID=575652 RepID=UPI003456B363